ncbi:restriction endonuclease subunit S [Pseudomonas sp. PCH199]|uniref:restriction endonuclease subunit S n=1 Tax=unclassified Pseudomonas TaxID=196821 RepID=UPI000BC927F0|nr:MULTISPECIES: restriction endonuclease subunit S [unclassified Pseudomonas]MCW8275953.1 restriction endonuclease subunit S [Pseudomonas sp. PCH199]PAM84027.1 restriction endonuclease [Pseudomonas sp. ERMR1:02]
MSSDCRWTLGDFVSLQRGTTYKGDLLGLPGAVLLGLASIQPNGGFRRGSFKTYGGDSPEKITLTPGEIYVSLKDVTQSGDLLGSAARVPKDIQRGRLTQDTVKLVFDGEPISTTYIYWLLRTPQYREYCRAHGTGTTTLGLAREDFLSFPVPQPTEAEASLVILLEALESRIELLNETNSTLEAIAQALFKSWFVDFEPVRAKVEGLRPTGLDAATAALFPDSFEESELGLVPKGWKIGSVGDLASVRGGFAFKSEDFCESGVPVVKIKNIVGDGTIDLTNLQYVNHGQALKSQRFALQDGDVLMAMTGATIGKSGIVVTSKGEAPLLNQRVAKFEPTPFGQNNNWLIYTAFQNSFMADQIINAASGSAQANISTTGIEGVKLVLPGNSVVLKAFDEIVSTIFSGWIENRKIFKTLIQLRDTLLPRLISGQMLLPEADASVENMLSEPA